MSSDRRAAVAALAVLTLAFLAGGALLGEVFGSSGDSDQTFIDHYASSQNRGLDIAGSSLLGVSGVAFLVFVAAMRRLLKPVDSLTGAALVVLPTWSAATAVALWRGRQPTAATEETVAAPGSAQLP